jgi:hypothetical protein
MVASVMGRFSTAQVLNGATAWSRITAARDTILDEDSIGVAQLVAEFHADPHHLLLAAAARDARVAFRGRETVGPKEADVLEVITAKGLRRVLFLDVESHRLVAMEDNPGARFPAGPTLRRVYGDYRTVEGILWPHTEDRILDGELAMSLKIKQVDFNSGVLNGMFERPATPAETHQTAPPRRR